MFRNIGRSLPVATLVVVSSLVGACSGTSFLPSLTTASIETTPAPSVPAAPPLALVALRSVAGTSPEYAQMLARELNERSKVRSVAIIADANAAAHTALVGSFKVRKAKGSTIIDYTWDVLEANGTLRRRATGTETVTLAKGATEPWSALPPVATSRIADKAYEALGTDLPKSAITTSSIEKVERKVPKE